MAIRVGNVVFDVPAESLATYRRGARAIGGMYADLLGMSLRSRLEVYRDAGYEPPAEDLEACESDPLVLHTDPDRPNIAFESSTGYQAPSWPDPTQPQQIHLDVTVADLGAADELVQSHGAVLLLRAEDHNSYADAVGHPFCLYPTTADQAKGARISRIVFDCFSPRALANFYEELLDMRVRLIDEPHHVEIASQSTSGPHLAFQHVWHIPPTWPDASYPKQLHIDFASDELEDEEAGQAVAERLGGIRLPFLGGGFVFADPAGHPFCLGE